jgi:large subunit ribosomal protein L30
MGKLLITQKRSGIGRFIYQKRTLLALGIRRLHQTVEHDDTPVIRGMIKTVFHLVSVEETGAKPQKRKKA